jgi:hypothetical protein
VALGEKAEATSVIPPNPTPPLPIDLELFDVFDSMLFCGVVLPPVPGFLRIDLHMS